ncbi:hypothetical protein [Roseovarius sp. A46]|uniref:hypothetical protein n=1 Tax=Roseovarius sp. A46 TaxID=2109331 RepID=UPI0013E998DD|nr:hypothetical protein [Roseovarius sp. A46]
MDTKKNVDFEYNTQEKLPLIHQVGFLCLINWSREGEVKFEVCCELGKLFAGSFGSNFEQQAWMVEFESVGHHLLDILGAEKSLATEFSFCDFEKLNNTIIFAASLFSAGSIRFEGEYDYEIDDFARAIGYYTGKVGEWSFAAIWRMPLVAREIRNDRHVFDFGQPEIIWKQAFKQPIDLLRKQVREEFIRYKCSQVESFATFQDGDLVALAKALFDERSIYIAVDDPAF